MKYSKVIEAKTNPEITIDKIIEHMNKMQEIKENWDSRFGDRENQVVFIGKG